MANLVEIKTSYDTYNFLYKTNDPEYLVQDLLTSKLANGIHVDVGWFPEHDPTGKYYIRVFENDWNSQKIVPVTTRDLKKYKQLLKT